MSNGAGRGVMLPQLHLENTFPSLQTSPQNGQEVKIYSTNGLHRSRTFKDLKDFQQPHHQGRDNIYSEMRVNDFDPGHTQGGWRVEQQNKTANGEFERVPATFIQRPDSKGLISPAIVRSNSTVTPYGAKDFSFEGTDKGLPLQTSFGAQPVQGATSQPTTANNRITSDRPALTGATTYFSPSTQTYMPLNNYGSVKAYPGNPQVQDDPSIVSNMNQVNISPIHQAPGVHFTYQALPSAYQPSTACIARVAAPNGNSNQTSRNASPRPTVTQGFGESGVLPPIYKIHPMFITKNLPANVPANYGLKRSPSAPTIGPEIPEKTVQVPAPTYKPQVVFKGDQNHHPRYTTLIPSPYNTQPSQGHATVILDYDRQPRATASITNTAPNYSTQIRIPGTLGQQIVLPQQYTTQLQPQNPAAITRQYIQHQIEPNFAPRTFPAITANQKPNDNLSSGQQNLDIRFAQAAGQLLSNPYAFEKAAPAQPYKVQEPPKAATENDNLPLDNSTSFRASAERFIEIPGVLSNNQGHDKKETLLQGKNMTEHEPAATIELRNQNPVLLQNKVVTSPTEYGATNYRSPADGATIGIENASPASSPRKDPLGNQVTNRFPAETRVVTIADQLASLKRENSDLILKNGQLNNRVKQLECKNVLVLEKIATVSVPPKQRAIEIDLKTAHDLRSSIPAIPGDLFKALSEHQSIHDALRQHLALLSKDSSPDSFSGADLASRRSHYENVLNEIMQNQREIIRLLNELLGGNRRWTHEETEEVGKWQELCRQTVHKLKDEVERRRKAEDKLSHLEKERKNKPPGANIGSANKANAPLPDSKFKSNGSDSRDINQKNGGQLEAPKHEFIGGGHSFGDQYDQPKNMANDRAPGRFLDDSMEEILENKGPKELFAINFGGGLKLRATTKKAANPYDDDEEEDDTKKAPHHDADFGKSKFKLKLSQNNLAYGSMVDKSESMDDKPGVNLKDSSESIKLEQNNLVYGSMIDKTGFSTLPQAKKAQTAAVEGIEDSYYVRTAGDAPLFSLTPTVNKHAEHEDSAVAPANFSQQSNPWLGKKEEPHPSAPNPNGSDSFGDDEASSFQIELATKMKKLIDENTRLLKENEQLVEDNNDVKRQLMKAATKSSPEHKDITQDTKNGLVIPPSLEGRDPSDKASINIEDRLNFLRITNGTEDQTTPTVKSNFFGLLREKEHSRNDWPSLYSFKPYDNPVIEDPNEHLRSMTDPKASQGIISMTGRTEDPKAIPAKAKASEVSAGEGVGLKGAEDEVPLNFNKRGSFGGPSVETNLMREFARGFVGTAKGISIPILNIGGTKVDPPGSGKASTKDLVTNLTTTNPLNQFPAPNTDEMADTFDQMKKQMSGNKKGGRSSAYEGYTPDSRLNSDSERHERLQDQTGKQKTADKRFNSWVDDGAHPNKDQGQINLPSDDRRLPGRQDRLMSKEGSFQAFAGSEFSGPGSNRQADVHTELSPPSPVGIENKQSNERGAETNWGPANNHHLEGIQPGQNVKPGWGYNQIDYDRLCFLVNKRDEELDRLRNMIEDTSSRLDAVVDENFKLKSSLEGRDGELTKMARHIKQNEKEKMRLQREVEESSMRLKSLEESQMTDSEYQRLLHECLEM